MLLNTFAVACVLCTSKCVLDCGPSALSRRCQRYPLERRLAERLSSFTISISSPSSNPEKPDAQCEQLLNCTHGCPGAASVVSRGCLGGDVECIAPPTVIPHSTPACDNSRQARPHKSAQSTGQTRPRTRGVQRLQVARPDSRTERRPVPRGRGAHL